MVRALLACAILLGCARSAFADDLLGTIPFLCGAGQEFTPYTYVSGVSFEIGYDGSPTGPVCARQRVGCTQIPIEQAVSGATFTFGPSSPWFAEIAATLTDGVNEQLWYVDRTTSIFGTTITNVGRRGLTEAETFGVPVDFQGSTITSIKLTLDSFALGDQASCGGGTPGGMCYQAHITWRIYGVPISTPAQRTTWGAIRATYR